MPDIVSNLGIRNLDGTYDTREIAVNYDNVKNLSAIMPLPKDSDKEKFLKGNGTWSKVGKGVNYGICHSGSSTTNKVAVTADGDYILEEGSFINIKFNYANTAINPTLNIDNTGDIDIKAYGDTAPVIWWDDDEIVSFTYDGTNFIMSTTEEQINVLKADKQDNIDNNLSTDNKTIVGAINELSIDKQNKIDNGLNTTNKNIVGSINELVTNKQNKTDNGLNTTNKNIVDSINELVTTCNSLDSNKQNKIDNGLDTTNKAVVDAINELLSACQSLDTNKQNKTDNSLSTTSKTVVGSINELVTTCSSLDTNKQNKTDNSLSTTNKTVVGSINEVLNKTNSKVKVNSSNVSSINFSLSGTTLTITTS